jgi:hypothetical protein
MFLLRKKLASKSPQTVGLTMQLIGTLVNNCGAQFHAAMNDEKFMREMGNAIRYFSKRPGAENKDATDVALDLVQSWGEAFLPKRKQFYHIVDLYFTLRKEGLPFKVQQFDPTRVPIFAGSGASGGADNTDAILAAALQSSMALEMEAEEAERRRQQSRHPAYSDDPRHGGYEDREVHSKCPLYLSLVHILTVVFVLTLLRSTVTSARRLPRAPPRRCSRCSPACPSSRT